MTIFQHTINEVLSGRKSQTSRIWKPNYIFIDGMNPPDDNITVLSSAKNSITSRKLYYVGQVLSVQPKRGAKGVAKIRILELAKRDVRDFTDEDIQREGFPHKTWFLHTWTEMHDKPMYRKLDYAELGSWHSELTNRPSEFYTALVIRFELVEKGK